VRSPLLELNGAVEATNENETLLHTVASHYGEPLREQRAFDQGRAIADLSHLGILTISGSDRLNWLHSMTSQSLTGLQPGDSAETLVLTLQGRVEFVCDVADDGERLWIMVDPQDIEGLYDFLYKMRFALRVELQRVDDDFAVLAATDAEALEFLESLDDTVVRWEDPWGARQPGGFQYAAGEHPGDNYRMVRVVVPRRELETVRDAVASGKVSVAGLDAVRAIEVAAWRPRRGDIDHRSLPHEFDWMRSAVHLHKGCYRGQETVAKVHNLGHPPRRIALLHLDGSSGVIPQDGDLVFVADSGDEARPVGRVTRVARHYEAGPIALALLKRSTAEDSELEIRCEDEIIAAAQEVIVPKGAAPSRVIPKLKRL
jgi:folate-binding protein YgfZ